ncbi:MAG: helix-turn-helix transcriptional regulator, partial [Victivallales bacterium]|nr:helix-turn-helix transcriptional regulator [Victivallales bacterium]
HEQAIQMDISRQSPEGIKGVRDLRTVALAASLLLHSKMSIDEIAEHTGFCDRYYFTRVFRKFRYTSPAKFRRGQTW